MSHRSYRDSENVLVASVRAKEGTDATSLFEAHGARDLPERSSQMMHPAVQDDLRRRVKDARDRLADALRRDGVLPEPRDGAAEMIALDEMADDGTITFDKRWRPSLKC